ncbi:MAG: hypothetical protein KIT60_07060 [Burkholderiaceae bacterium]|nr:hypothetical protein [Burkholderiaceae bacterium]
MVRAKRNDGEATQEYRVIGNLEHDGERYGVGDTVSLPERDAQPLLAANVIQPMAPEAPAAV